MSIPSEVVQFSSDLCHQKIISSIQQQAKAEGWSNERLQEEIETAELAKKLFLKAMDASVPCQNPPPMKKCFNPACNVLREKMLSCARCLTTTYCSKECQTTHWKTHKIVCQIPLS